MTMIVRPGVYVRVEQGQSVILQYYYRADGCKATSAHDPDCICWHDEGTGPLADGIHQHPHWARRWRIEDPPRD